MNNLAQMLTNNNEIEQDTQRANQLYERAIREGGNVTAMINLGSSYQYGLGGVTKNTTRAKELYEMTISKGSFLGLSFLAHLHEEGDAGCERDVGKAKALYERAVREGGDSAAMADLGALLETGAGGTERNGTSAERNNCTNERSRRTSV